MRTPSADYRPLTENERAILDVLLQVPFAGRDEVRQQLEDCLVKRIDGEGSLEFIVTKDVRAPVTTRIPVEGEMVDEDGIPVRLLLHVVEDTVRELEIYKGDGSPLIKTLTPSGLRLVRADEDIRLDGPALKL